MGPTLLVAALTAMLVAVLAGCAERQEIIEQTVCVKAEDLVAETEASQVTDEFLTWTKVSEVDPGFDEARAVAFGPDDALYVAGDEAVRKMTGDGQVEWELPVSGEPACLTFDPDGALLVGLRKSVEVYDQGGQLLQTLAIDERRTWVTSIAAWSDDRFVADAGNRRVLRYDASGERVGEIIGEDQQPGIPKLSVPSPHLDLVAGADGNLWMTNPGRRSIQVLSRSDGSMVASWDRRGNDVAGFLGCCNPTDIALLPDDRVVTAEKGLPRVKVYSGDGELLSVVAGPDTFRSGTAGIDVATDSSGRVAVLDPKRRVVRLYEEEGGEQEAVENE